MENENNVIQPVEAEKKEEQAIEEPKQPENPASEHWIEKIYIPAESLDCVVKFPIPFTVLGVGHDGKGIFIRLLRWSPEQGVRLSVDVIDCIDEMSFELDRSKYQLKSFGSVKDADGVEHHLFWRVALNVPQQPKEAAK